MRLRPLIPLAPFALPLVAFAADTSSSGFDTTYIKAFTTGPNGIVGIINDYLVPVIFTLALLVFLYGVAKAYIFNRDSDTERSKGHKFIMWAVVGFAVMLSVWGLVNLLQTILGLSGSSSTSPTAPTINTGS